MPEQLRPEMPTSLFWLSDDLYWRQNLAVAAKAAVNHEQAGAPFRTMRHASTGRAQPQLSPSA